MAKKSRQTTEQSTEKTPNQELEIAVNRSQEDQNRQLIKALLGEGA